MSALEIVTYGPGWTLVFGLVVLGLFVHAAGKERDR